MRLRVDLLPRGPYEDVVLVVDVLRATTTAPLIFERGAERLYLTESVRSARSFAAEGGFLLAGDRDGMPPEGFNYSVSPAAMQGVDLGGRSVVLTTQNGPKAVRAVMEAPHVLLASFYNARAAALVALERASSEIAVACAGFEDAEALEDTLAAGLLVRRIEREHPLLAKGGELEFREGARLSTKLLRAFPDPQEALVQSAAGLILRRLGLEEDIALASLVSQTECVPVLREVIAWQPAPVFVFEAVRPGAGS